VALARHQLLLDAEGDSDALPPPPVQKQLAGGIAIARLATSAQRGVALSAETQPQQW